MIEALIMVSNDEQSDVSKMALEALKEFEEKEGNRITLLKTLEERLFSVICQLPTNVKSQENREIMNSLYLLRGGLKLSGPDFMAIPIHMHRLVRSLALILSYDLHSPQYLQERIVSQDPFDMIGESRYFGRNFKWLSHDAVDLILSICEQLGETTNLSHIVDSCLDFFKETKVHRK